MAFFWKSPNVSSHPENSEIFLCLPCPHVSDSGKWHIGICFICFFYATITMFKKLHRYPRVNPKEVFFMYIYIQLVIFYYKIFIILEQDPHLIPNTNPACYQHWLLQDNVHSLSVSEWRLDLSLFLLCTIILVTNY